MGNSLLRSAYDRAAQKFAGFIMNRHVLRMEQLLTSNKSSYTFQCKQGNSSSDGPLEVRLNDNDAFVLVGLSLGIKKQDLSLDPVQVGNFPIWYYPETTVFTGTPTGQATEASSLMCIYNGQVSFRTGSVERIKPMPAYDSYYGPERIGSATPNAGGFDMRNSGMIELQPTFLLDGAQNNEFVLNLGQGDYTGIDGSWNAGTQGATSRNVVVLQAYGILIHNGAQKAERWKESWYNN